MGIGVWQIVLILAIVLIIFGAGKLPKVMGDFGKGIKSFKSGLKEAEDAASVHPKEISDSSKDAASIETIDAKPRNNDTAKS